MEIENASNRADVVAVEKSHKGGLVRLNIGLDQGKARHANLKPAAARPVAYALLSCAEQVGTA